MQVCRWRVRHRHRVKVVLLRVRTWVLLRGRCRLRRLRQEAAVLRALRTSIWGGFRAGWSSRRSSPSWHANPSTRNRLWPTQSTGRSWHGWSCTRVFSLDSFSRSAVQSCTKRFDSLILLCRSPALRSSTTGAFLHYACRLNGDKLAMRRPSLC